MRHIVSSKGTSDISEWWVTTLITDLVAQLAGWLGMFYWLSDELAGMLAAGCLFAVAAFSLWLSVAGLRDRGRPPWTFALGLMPVIGWIWLLVECGFLPPASRGPKRILVTRTVQAEAPAAGDPTKLL